MRLIGRFERDACRLQGRVELRASRRNGFQVKPDRKEFIYQIPELRKGKCLGALKNETKSSTRARTTNTGNTDELLVFML